MYLYIFPNFGSGDHGILNFTLAILISALMITDDVDTRFAPESGTHSNELFMDFAIISTRVSVTEIPLNR
jgi:hypothetical protein